MLRLESLRWGIMINKEDWEKEKSYYFWPNATCQKLFYDDHTVVNSVSDAKLDMKLGNNYSELLLMFCD